MKGIKENLLRKFRGTRFYKKMRRDVVKRDLRTLCLCISGMVADRIGYFSYEIRTQEEKEKFIREYLNVIGELLLELCQKEKNSRVMSDLIMFLELIRIMRSKI